mmetsp:Transcript_35975/g.92655  ORF Transcript_35975/g.92655 Transcript_35975/m.92655 type:complete len:359 (+) Transcript_35975:693-1769(+)
MGQGASVGKVSAVDNFAEPLEARLEVRRAGLGGWVAGAVEDVVDILLLRSQGRHRGRLQLVLQHLHIVVDGQLPEIPVRDEEVHEVLHRPVTRDLICACRGRGFLRAQEEVRVLPQHLVLVRCQRLDEDGPPRRGPPHLGDHKLGQADRRVAGFARGGKAAGLLRVVRKLALTLLVLLEQLAPAHLIQQTSDLCPQPPLRMVDVGFFEVGRLHEHLLRAHAEGGVARGRCPPRARLGPLGPLALVLAAAGAWRRASGTNSAGVGLRHLPPQRRRHAVPPAVHHLPVPLGLAQSAEQLGLGIGPGLRRRLVVQLQLLLQVGPHCRRWVIELICRPPRRLMLVLKAHGIRHGSEAPSCTA